MHVVAAISYIVLALIAIGLYALVLYILRKHYETDFKQHSFYLLVMSLALADLGYLAMNVLLIPAYLLAGRQLLSDVWHDLAFSANTLFFFSLAGTSWLIAFNRLCAFQLATLNRILFQRQQSLGHGKRAKSSPIQCLSAAA